MIKYPSINQFKNTIKDVEQIARYAGKDENGQPFFDNNKPLPTLTFRGTTKLHGTNAAIVFYPKAENGKNLIFQSRERELSLQHDNMGFMLYMMSQGEAINILLGNIYTSTNIKPEDHVVIFGEWCGEGIQKGVGISALPRMFVVFGIMIDGKWIDFLSFSFFHVLNQSKIYSIHQFSVWYTDIDFNRPDLSQKHLIDLTEQVEKECPVARSFGIRYGLGEGIVWQCINPGYETLLFKVKGEKHSVSKVSTLASIHTEVLGKLCDFADTVVTQNRLEQGMFVLQNEMLLPLESTSTGKFISWIFNDIIKEETDTIVANQIDPKKLHSVIAKKARTWFLDTINSVKS